jgi:hypothetical protein
MNTVQIISYAGKLFEINEFVSPTELQHFIELEGESGSNLVPLSEIEMTLELLVMSSWLTKFSNDMKIYTPKNKVYNQRIAGQKYEGVKMNPLYSMDCERVGESF